MGEVLNCRITEAEFEAIVAVRAKRCAHHIVDSTLNTPDGLLYTDSFLVVCDYLAKLTNHLGSNTNPRDLAGTAIYGALVSLNHPQIDISQTVDFLFAAASPDLG